MPLEKLAQFIEQTKPEARERVTLLPDLFVDQIVDIPRTPSQFLTKAAKITAQGGGNYIGANLQLTRGGCAANCAAAISALGIHTSLISRTSELGLHLLKVTTNPKYLDYARVKTNGRLAATVALETREEGHVFNLMISDPGSVASFSPSSLNQADIEIVTDSSLVGIFSWNLIDKGTELIEKIAKLCKQTYIQTYVDLGDPNPKIHRLPSLLDKVFRTGMVDFLSVNENELRCVSKALNIRNWRNESLSELAKEVTHQLRVELALHTPEYSGLFQGKKAVFCPVFDVTVKRSTGAGDAWNAGNIFGLLRGVGAELRLMMANLVAALYVSSPQPDVHTLREISRFLKRARLKPIDNLS